MSDDLFGTPEHEIFRKTVRKFVEEELRMGAMPSPTGWEEARSHQLLLASNPLRRSRVDSSPDPAPFSGITFLVLTIQYCSSYPVTMARVTVKGQVTIPKKLRTRFGISTQTEVEFRQERGRLVLVKKTTGASIGRIRGRLKRLPFGRDVDDYLKATRGER